MNGACAAFWNKPDLSCVHISRLLVDTSYLATSLQPILI